LLELLVVISILAILATVATRSLLSVGEQAQLDANDALVRDIRRALVGNPNSFQSDNTALVSGLIADLGRPPRAELETFAVGENEASTSPTGKAYTLRELVSQRTSPAFNLYKTEIGLVTSTFFNPGVTNIALYDGTNSIATGWRGPYLQGGNDDIIDDGWGKPVAAYSAPASRRLVNLWITSYQNSAAAPPTMSPFSGVSINGYHDVGSGFGDFPFEVVGVLIRPGPSATAVVGNSMSLASYSNALSAGIAWTNDYVAQLLCNISFNTNAMTDQYFINPAFIPNYYYLAGVIMYGPNPFYNSASAAISSSYANSRPVGVAYLATGNVITGDGVGSGASVNYPNPTSITFMDYPLKFTTGGPVPNYNYPLVLGPRVVKPFLVAKRKNTVATGTDVVLFTGTARSIILRPGYNSVQLCLP